MDALEITAEVFVNASASVRNFINSLRNISFRNEGGYATAQVLQEELRSVLQVLDWANNVRMSSAAGDRLRQETIRPLAFLIQSVERQFQARAGKDSQRRKWPLKREDNARIISQIGSFRNNLLLILSMQQTFYPF